MIDADNNGFQPKNAHPYDTVSPSKFTNYDTESLRSSSVSDMDSCLIKKPRPSSGSYVIQVPKDQIYRVPPPENARLFESYSRRGTRHRRCRCCCCPSLRCAAWTTSLLVLVAFALAATAGIVYLVSRPKLPRYTLDGLSIRGFDVGSLTGSNSTVLISPKFEAEIRAHNPNKKIRIQYRAGSSASVAYSDVALASGAWPAFRQGTRNVTVVRAALRGSGVRLPGELIRRLQEQQARGEVPLEVNARVRIRVRLGPVTSWTFRVQVKCDVVVDKLAANSRIISKNCHSSSRYILL